MHTPVLLKEVLQYLAPAEGNEFVDCTYGSGGHSKEILKRVGKSGKLLSIDWDSKNIDRATQQGKPDNLYLVCDNYKNLSCIAERLNFRSLNGVLLDLGLSSEQLADSERGFSFQSNSYLDMRYLTNNLSNSNILTASEIINTFREVDLADIFWKYGEERYSRSIARNIVKERQVNKILTTQDLVRVITSSVPARYLHQKIHPATRVFQALRIAVNQELDNLTSVLSQILNLLVVGGRVAVISFHSLEDRIVKKFFKTESMDCICPSMFMVCVCNHKSSLKIITKKPVTATLEEIQANPRSRSAKLRVAEKI